MRSLRSTIILSACCVFLFSAGAAAQTKGKNVAAHILSLQSKESAVREKAARALGALGPSAAPAVEQLLLTLSDSDPYVSGAAADALSSIGAPALPGLIRTLRSTSDTLRWCAVIALSKMGAEAHPAVPALTDALADSSATIRWGSAVALGNIGEKSRPAIPALLHRLSDADQDVCAAASLALSKIDAAAVEFPSGWSSVASVIDSLVPHLMKETHVPGTAVTLISKGEIVWSGSYGIANEKSGRAVTAGTLFEACSMSKPVFAYVAMKLAEEGLLNLDKPLHEYLPLSSLRGQPGAAVITARMVLAHTSGLPNWRKGDEERDGPLPLLFPPGSKFGYSGEGFYYLQQVVEKITGEPLHRFARRTLFEPLGMNECSFIWTKEADEAIAAGHDNRGRFLQKTRYEHPNAAYSLYVSAENYARFLCEMMKKERSAKHSLRQRSVDTMLSRQTTLDAREPIERPGRAKGLKVFWGLGWSINETGRGDVYHHSGSNRSGFRCFSQFDPAAGSGIVIMTNGTGGSDLWTRLISRIGNL